MRTLGRGLRQGHAAPSQRERGKTSPFRASGAATGEGRRPGDHPWATTRVAPTGTTPAAAAARGPLISIFSQREKREDLPAPRLGRAWRRAPLSNLPQRGRGRRGGHPRGVPLREGRRPGDHPWATTRVAPTGTTPAAAAARGPLISIFSQREKREDLPAPRLRRAWRRAPLSNLPHRGRGRRGAPTRGAPTGGMDSRERGNDGYGRVREGFQRGRGLRCFP